MRVGTITHKKIEDMETMIVTPQAEMTMKQKLQDILMIVSWREIAATISESPVHGFIISWMA